MDKPRELRGPDTPQIELERVLTWLIKNGFEMEGVTEVYHPRFRYDDMSVAHFIKNIDYIEENGDANPDSYMKVSVQFEKRADFNHITETEDGLEYDREPYEFIDELMDNITEKQRKINTLTRLVKMQKKQRKTSKKRSRKYKSI
jgi:hypothetical protein